MGVIRRQSIKQSLVNYLATGIGAVSILFIYPREEEMYGLALFLTGTANFLFPFASLGITTLSIRFFPFFRDDARESRNFLGLLLLGIAASFLLFSLLGLLAGLPALRLLDLFGFNIQLFQQYALEIWSLCFLVILSNLLTVYISNFHRIVIPAVLNNLWPKMALPALILALIAGWIDSTGFVYGILGYHALAVAGLFLYLFHLGRFDVRPKLPVIERQQLKNMGVYALYGMLGMLGTVFAFRIDHIMISTLIGLTNTGIYGIAQFIGTSIEMPARSVYGIASPIIASAIKEDKLEEIQNIYSRSSLILTLFGFFIFLAVWLSLDDLFRLTTKYEALSSARYVVLFVSLSKLADMLNSVNGQIISYSPYFRTNLVAILLLGIFNVGLNFWLIPKLGITGAALATFISVAIYNFLRTWYVWFRYRIHPFTVNTFLILAIGGAVLLILPLLPDFSSPLINIGKNSLLAAAAYFIPIYYFNLSEDLNGLVRDLFGKLRKFLKN